jgi:hypothetical protein
MMHRTAIMAHPSFYAYDLDSARQQSIVNAATAWLFLADSLWYYMAISQGALSRGATRMMSAQTSRKRLGGLVEVFESEWNW